METSAKTGVNVELAFTAVAKYGPVFMQLHLYFMKEL